MLECEFENKVKKTHTFLAAGGSNRASWIVSFCFGISSELKLKWIQNVDQL